MSGPRLTPLSCLALLAGGLLVPYGELAAQVSGEEERLLMEVRIEGGPRGLTPAVVDGQRLLLALHPILSLAGIEVLRAGEVGPLSAMIHPEEIGLSVDPDAGALQRGPLETAFLADEGFRLEGEVYLARELVEILLDVRLNVSLESQLVLVRGGEDLPAVRDLERQRRADQVALAGQGVPVAGMVPASDPGLFGGAALDWRVDLGSYSSSAVQEFSTRFQGGRVALGAEVFGGSLAAVYSRVGGTTSVFGTDRTEFSWFRAWPRNRWFRQLRLGDVAGTGPFGRFYRGASVSNIPFIRPIQFAVDPVMGSVPAGWEVELYRGERLLDRGVAGPDGGFSFDVPTQFGFNPYQVRAFGPNGQTQEFDRTFFVFQERLPAGQFEYSAGGGQCRYAACDGVANLDLRWGVTEFLTLRGGAVGLWYDSIPDRQALYGSATFQPMRAISLTGNVVGHTLAEGVLRLYPSRALQMDVGYGYFEAESPDPRQNRAMDSGVARASIQYRPAFLGRRTSFRLFGTRTQNPLETRNDIGFAVASQISRLRLDIGARRVASDPVQYEDRVFHRGYLRSSWQVSRGRGILSGTIVRSGLGFEEQLGLESAFVGVSQPFGRQFRVALQSGWDEYRGTSLRLDVKLNLTGLRWNSRNEVYEGGGQGTQSLQGSVLFGSAERPISFGDGLSVGRAGVSGVAFQDLDGDGERSEGEPVIPGVRVRLEGRLERTDVTGAYSVWDLAPFEEVRVQVDPSGGPDPEWTPLNEAYQIFPEPNRFTRVDIPFIRTMEVIGEVRLRPGNRRVGGIDVLLRPLDPASQAQQKQYRATTFTDGGFYFMGVAPGSYRIIILQPGLPGDAAGVDAGLLEVQANESGVVGDVNVTIGPADLDRLKQQLQDYLDQQLLGDSQASAAGLQDQLRDLAALRERAHLLGEDVRWIVLPRSTAGSAPIEPAGVGNR